MEQNETSVTPEQEAVPAAEENSAAAAKTKSPTTTGSRRLWLLAISVLGLCFLGFCLAGAGLVFWPLSRRSEPPDATGGSPAQVEEVAAQSETSTPPANRLPQTTPTPQTLVDSLPVAKPVAVPTLCQQPQVSASPAITRPVMSPISFSTRQAADGWPLDARLQFSTAISQIQASFSFAGMSNGQPWERVWYFGDQEVFRGSGTWEAGARGQLTVYSQVAEAGFVPGRYRLEIHVDGQPLTRGEFLLVAEGADTHRPVDVAFSSWDGERHQVNLLNLETGQVEPLLEFASHPVWSPDAVGLLFVGEAGISGGEPGLWVFNTRQQKSYPLNEQTDYGPIDWSPYRTYLATALKEADGSRLFLQNTTNFTMYPGPPGQDPAWSPEGRRLAYRGCSADGWSISTIDVIGHIFDSETIRQLTGGDDSQPTWSPDGRRIAFVRRQDDSPEIYTVAADGGQLTRLTDDDWPDAAPVWLPDGRILYQSLRDGQWRLVVMNADGSAPEQLITTDSSPDWQPDRPAVSPDYRLVEPTPTPPPKPRVHVPAGKGILVVSNLQNDDEMTFTIDNTENKIPAGQYRTLPLNPGHYTWTASWPGRTSRTGIADIVLGQVSYPVIER